MQLPSTYTLDKEELKLNLYRLVCLFHANKEIARSSDPDGSNTVSELERQFFPREMTRLLLSIAVGVRVLDDQMNALPCEDLRRRTYETKRNGVNEYYKCIMWFDEMPLRQVCNKIIHATLVVEPHSTEGKPGDHEIDHQNYLGWAEACDQSPGETIPEPEPIQWSHLSCNIRLGGQYRDGKQWYHLLDVLQFIDAVRDILDD